MQTTLHILGVKAMPQALAALRGSGQSDLAKRVARQSKARNWMAHPDTCLHQDLQHFMAADIMRAELEEPKGADAFFMGEPTADAAVQTSPRRTKLDYQSCSGVSLGTLGVDTGCTMTPTGSTGRSGTISNSSTSEAEALADEGGAIAVAFRQRWADMDTSDTSVSGDHCVDDLAVCSNKSYWLEKASKRECDMVRKWSCIFGRIIRDRQREALSFAWLPKPLLASGSDPPQHEYELGHAVFEKVEKDSRDFVKCAACAEEHIHIWAGATKLAQPAAEARSPAEEAKLSVLAESDGDLTEEAKLSVLTALRIRLGLSDAEFCDFVGVHLRPPG
jgi:hypothetical protein